MSDMAWRRNGLDSTICLYRLCCKPEALTHESHLHMATTEPQQGQTLRSRCTLFYTCPTGGVLTAEDMSKACRQCRRCGLPLASLISAPARPTAGSRSVRAGAVEVVVAAMAWHSSCTVRHWGDALPGLGRPGLRTGERQRLYNPCCGMYQCMQKFTHGTGTLPCHGSTHNTCAAWAVDNFHFHPRGKTRREFFERSGQQRTMYVESTRTPSATEH